MEELSGGVKHLTVSNHATKTLPEKLQMFYEYCKVRLEPCLENNADQLGIIGVPTETSHMLQHYHIEGFRRHLIVLSLFRPIGVSLSDSYASETV